MRKTHYPLILWSALSCAVCVGTVARAEHVSPRVGVSGQQYATDLGPSSRVDLSGSITSETNLYGRNIPSREMHLYSFFETGELGDRSFDLDTMVLRFRESDQSHFWIGRNHPLYEGFENSPSTRALNTAAIGANWVQNQSEALSPRAMGWIGGGFHYKQPKNGIYFTTAFSPVFLPSFGPRVDLSEHEAAKGSHFGNLPPAYIDINNDGNYFPMRYRVKINDLKDIIFQPQFFAAVGQENDFHRLTFMIWSAPAPAPQVTTFGKVQIVSEAGVNILVEATPLFVRENFLGGQWLAHGLPWQPRIEAVYETRSNRATFSASASPLSWVSFGLMTAVGLPAADPASPVVAPAPYAKDLTWLELTPAPIGAHFSPSLRIEQHLTAGARGRWVKPLMTYRLSSITSFFAVANILTGPDRSYFGNWKSLDSVSLGARFIW